MPFDGGTYDPALDYERLSSQLSRVRMLMVDGQWRSLYEIHEDLGRRDSEAAISARLRDLRKPKFGGHTVERRRRSRSLFEYRLILRDMSMQPKLRIVPDQPAAIDPLLKWAGGKRKFVREFGNDMFDLVAHRGGRYIEPFLGGAAMALHLGIKGMVLNDVEEELIITYHALRDTPGQLATLLELIVETMGTSKDAYYHVRETPPNSATEVAARLIYLNKLCFNGIYRKNKSGEFNVPYGGNDKRTMPTRERIMEVSRALVGADISQGDFTDVIDDAKKGDVIYADPPYHGTFSDYTAHGFNDDDHERLAESLYHARQRGAEFFCHNADTEKVRYWFDGWTEIIPVQERRNVNADGDGRGEVGCVLVAGVDDE